MSFKLKMRKKIENVTKTFSRNKIEQNSTVQSEQNTKLGQNCSMMEL